MPTNADAERRQGPTFDPSKILWLDFEARNPGQSINIGSYAYACSADAIVLAYAIGDGPAQVSAVKDFGTPLALPLEVRNAYARVRAGEMIACAWNATFDRAIWNYATEGWPLLEPHHVIDAMAQASAAGLPADLAKASLQAGGSVKLSSGKELIKLFCLPGAEGTPATHPQEWREFLAYAKADIEAMRDVFRRTKQLAMAEWREYWAMERVNDAGVEVDLPMVTTAAKLAGEDRARSAHELAKLTGEQVHTVDQVARMVAWLNEVLPAEGRKELERRAEEVDEDGNVTRPARYQLTRKRVQALLAYCQNVDFPRRADAVRVLQIRLYGGSKTPQKFAKILSQHVDGRLYGQYVFGGAGQTGRASSRGVQVHNLARDALPYELEALEALQADINYGAFNVLDGPAGDPVARKLSLLIRPAFVPARGNIFVWSDWSQIEARVLPWLAGNEPGALDRLDIFRKVDFDPSLPDLYTRTAATLSGVPVEQVTKAMRQRGKVAELSLGYGGGAGALQNMAANYGLHLDDTLARDTVMRWRAGNGWCVAFWGWHADGDSMGLWGAIHRALQNPETPQYAGRICYFYRPSYFEGSLLCVLPSRRVLTYRNIREDQVPILDDDDNVVGYERCLRFARGYGRVKFWHGLACENVVQAASADVLRGTLRRLVEQGSPVRLHCHDEILLEVLENDAEYARRALREVMRRGFSWSAGLPLMSEETVCYYYTKCEKAFIHGQGDTRNDVHTDISALGGDVGSHAA